MTGLMTVAAIFGTAFVVALSGAMMPGPLLAVTIHESARRGAWAGPMLILGHAILESLLVGAVALGLVAVFDSARFTGTVGLAGGAFMCWMGWDMLRSVRRLSLAAPEAGATRLHPVAAGVLMSLSNPYWIIWWATVGCGYLVWGLQFGVLGVCAFFCGHILADLAWYSLVSIGVARGRRFVSDSVYRGLIACCAVALSAFGVGFVWSGAAALGGAR